MKVNKKFLHFLHDLLVGVFIVFLGLENFSTQFAYELLLGVSYPRLYNAIIYQRSMLTHSFDHNASFNVTLQHGEG